MKLKTSLLLVLVLGMNIVVFGQLKKAQKHFVQKEFGDAIRYYHKVLKKDSLNIEATQNLAFSYYQLKNYVPAEKYYAKAIKINPSESVNFLYYGRVLKNNDKLDEAKEQLEKFVAQNPNSFAGRVILQSFKDISYWDAEEKEFNVKLVENINSIYADFSPLAYKDGIVFTSERKVDLIKENNAKMTDKPYFSIFYASKEKQYKNPSLFSSQITSTYHDGPVFIDTSGKELYFTRTKNEEKGKDYVNRLQIFSASLVNGKWDNITPFQYNSEKYSVGHPWLSEDGQRLFFSSDMPNGYGGMDIYVCTKKDSGKWSLPTNLGGGINTAEDEVFPYYRKETLYFSSEGHSGYGGLDVFTSKESENWESVTNLKKPLNSSKDDFGVFYTDDDRGYFSSNRKGGVGSDDIYSFTWQKIISSNHFSGVVAYDKLNETPMTIKLMDEEDQTIESATVDSLGNFKFEQIKADKDYWLALLDENDEYIDDADLYVTNSNGEKVMLMRKIGKGRYKFKTLPYDVLDGLALLEENDGTTVEIVGRLYKKLPGDYSTKMEVWLLGDDDSIIAKAITDSNGFFKFEKLSNQDQYLFMLAEDDSDVKMAMLNNERGVLIQTKRLIDGKYRYTKLKPGDEVLTKMDEDDNQSLAVVIFGQLYKILPGDYSTRMEVWVLDDNENIIGRAKTDDKGYFKFEKLSEADQYLFMLAEIDPDVQMIILSETGEVLDIAKRLMDGKYLYNKLKESKDVLVIAKEVDTEEVIIIDEEEATETVLGQIYQTLPGDYSSGIKVIAMDDEGNVVATAITNEDGFFKFEKLPKANQHLFLLPEVDAELSMNILNKDSVIINAAKKLIEGQYNYTKLEKYENYLLPVEEKDTSKVVFDKHDNFVSLTVKFRYQSYYLTEHSRAIIDLLIPVLENDNKIGLRLGAHTDSKGDVLYNEHLAQKRADEVLNYLVIKGIENNRISIKNYGETKPVAPNVFPDGSDNPRGRAKNRRVEFEMIDLIKLNEQIAPNNTP